MSKGYLKSKILFTLFLLTFSCPVAQAATVSLRPTSSSVDLGNIVTLSVLIDTQGETINNAEARINFPKDLLEVVSLGTSGSIFTLWVEQPGFSNREGTIDLNGGVPNPGYVGSGGKILTITFRTKKAGTASVIFTSAAIRANDGLGTNVFSGQKNASITIGSASPAAPEAPVAPEPVVPKKQTAALTLESPTHPNENSWYGTRSGLVKWDLPSGTLAIQTNISASASGQTTTSYEPAISQKSFDNLPDGRWYFLARARDRSGWSTISSYRLQIDSTPPLPFTINPVRNTGGDLTINLKTSDNLSGIDYYSLIIDEQSPRKIPASLIANNPLILPPLSTGTHSITIIAYDRAGNHAEAKAMVTSEGLPSPVITDYPKSLESGQSAEIKGEAPFASSTLRLWIRSDNNELVNYDLSSGSRFSFQTEPFSRGGLYTVWVETVGEGDVRSAPSNLVYINVHNSLLIRLSDSTIRLLSVIIPLIGLLLLLIFLLYFGWHKFFGLRHRLHHELAGTEKQIHHALSVLLLEVKSQLAALERAKKRRGLSKKEEDTWQELSTAIEQVDNYISKQFKNLEKDV